MNQIAINPNPIMTDYLIRSVKAFESDPIVILDIGARGGFNREWAVFGDQCRIYCFEPDEEECRRLNAEAASNVVYIPHAVGGTGGPAILYEAKLGASTGLYRTDMNYFGRLLNRDNGIVVAEHKVDVRTLDDVMAEYKIPTPSFIKLDVEGAEVDVLRGASSRLGDSSVLGILSEIRFQSEINGSPTFSALDILVQPYGLRLFDMQFYHQSRRNLPYPSIHDYRLPTGERFFAYTRHGQIQDGDALYFRDLLVSANATARREVSAQTVLKLCVLLEIYSFNDCAAELIEAFSEKLRPVVSSQTLLDLLATGIQGHKIKYDDYLRDYFAGPRTTPTAAASISSALGVSTSAARTNSSEPASTRRTPFIEFIRQIAGWLPYWMARPLRRFGRNFLQSRR